MLAVAHILIPIIILDFLRDHVFRIRKNIITNKHIFIAGIAGILPDVDIPISIFLFNETTINRTYTHSIWIPIALLAVSFFLHYFKKKEYSKILLMVVIGLSFHILLDFVTSGYVSLFIPFSYETYGLNLLPTSEAFLIYTSVDAILLIAWLVHEEITHRISDII